jgi:hypothetical protein
MESILDAATGRCNLCAFRRPWTQGAGRPTIDATRPIVSRHRPDAVETPVDNATAITTPIERGSETLPANTIPYRPPQPAFGGLPDEAARHRARSTHA